MKNNKELTKFKKQREDINQQIKKLEESYTKEIESKFVTLQDIGRSVLNKQFSNNPEDFPDSRFTESLWWILPGWKIKKIDENGATFNYPRIYAQKYKAWGKSKTEIVVLWKTLSLSDRDFANEVRSAISAYHWTLAATDKKTAKQEFDNAAEKLSKAKRDLDRAIERFKIADNNHTRISDARLLRSRKKQLLKKQALENEHSKLL